MKATQTKARVESTFSDSEEVNIFQSQKAISLARSLYYWPKNPAMQFLKGNFDRTPNTCTLKDMVLLSLLAFCYQSISENKAALKKKEEARCEAEDAFEVPESHRATAKALVANSGSLSIFQHAVGLLANFITILKAVVVPGFKDEDQQPSIS